MCREILAGLTSWVTKVTILSGCSGGVLFVAFEVTSLPGIAHVSRHGLQSLRVIRISPCRALPAMSTGFDTLCRYRVLICGCVCCASSSYALSRPTFVIREACECPCYIHLMLQDVLYVSLLVDLVNKSGIWGVNAEIMVIVCRFVRCTRGAKMPGSGVVCSCASHGTPPNAIPNLPNHIRTILTHWDALATSWRYRNNSV